MPWPWGKQPKSAKDDEIVEGGLTLAQIMEERQEYVKNIGIEYRFGCLEEQNADSCQLLGEYFEAVETNFKAAMEIFRENCEKRRHPRSCYKYGQYLAGGRECEPSFKKAMEPLEIACEADIGRGCKWLSLIHWNGEPSTSVAPNPEKAAEYAKRACDLGDFGACWTLSTWYMGPTTKFVKDSKGHQATQMRQKSGGTTLPRDMAKALAYGQKACDEGELYQSCANMSLMYRTGDGIPKDADKANEYHTKAKEYLKKSKEGWESGFTG